MLERLKRKIAFLLLTTKSFHLFQNLGVHVTPIHFYSPVPDLRELERQPLVWERRSSLPGICMHDTAQLKLMKEIFTKYLPECEFPSHPTGRSDEYYSQNGYFGFISAAAMHSIIRHVHPTKVIEVGAGYSTRVIANAIRLNTQDGFPAEIIAIDPYPDQDRFSGLPSELQLIVSKVQDVDLGLLTNLREGDILSIDTSHVVRTGGDVVFLYLEVLPRLAPGVLIHIHDIFFPCDYPKHFVQRRHFWNEQYLLQAFLIGNTFFEVIWSQKYAEMQFPEEYARVFGKRISEVENCSSYSFWMRSSAR